MDKKLHIAIFDGSFETTTFIRRLIKGLIENSIKVSVLGFNENLKNKIEGVHYIKLGSNQNKYSFIENCIKMKPFSLLTYKYLLKGNRKALQQQNLQLALKNINPDIIHVQWPSLLSWMEDNLKNDKIPIVLSERGSQILVKAKVYSDFKKKLTNYYLKLSGIHAVSKNIALTSKMLLKHQVHTQVIYSGLNINNWSFYPREQKQDNQFIHFLSIGRAHYIKGYSYTIQALAFLKNKGVRFTYTIIGGADEELTYLIQYYQLSKEIKIVGKLPISTVKDYYSKSDALLLSSLSEGVANVAIEAMANGLPVISADVGGMAELIDHQKTGFLFKSRNPIAMLHTIETYLKYQPEQIKVLTERARKKIEHTFTSDKMINDMIYFYNSVIKESA